MKTYYVALSRPHLHSPPQKHLVGRSQASDAEARAGNEPSPVPCKEAKVSEFGGQRNQLELGRRRGAVRVEMYREDEGMLSSRDRRHSSSRGRRWRRRRLAAMDIPRGIPATSVTRPKDMRAALRQFSLPLITILRYGQNPEDVYMAVQTVFSYFSPKVLKFKFHFNK